MTSHEEKAQAALNQSKEQRRTTSDATTDTTAATPDRTEAIKEALLAVEDDEIPENINIRDARLKALLVGLQDADELGSVAEDLAAGLDTEIDSGDVSQSDVARLLIRSGLQEAAPDLLSDATEARQQAALEQANDF